MSPTSADWASLTQLVQDLIAGAVHRNRFNQWELNLLLDLQLARLRKSSRAEALRRYLRGLQVSLANGDPEPPRFSAFLSRGNSRRAAAGGVSTG